MKPGTVAVIIAIVSAPVATLFALEQAQARGGGRAATTTSVTGGWTRRVSKSQMDDSKTVTFSLLANNEVSGWLVRKRPTLLARCKEGTTDLYVNLGFPAAVESGDTRTVRWRLDDAEATTEYWDEST